MKLHVSCLSLMLVALSGLTFPAGSNGAVTAEHRKQVDEVKKELGKVSGLIGKKDFEGAAKLLDDAEKKLKDAARDAEIDENHKLISGLFRQIEQKREAIAKKRGAGAAGNAAGRAGGFERDVAPILVARCVRCHGEDNQRGDLRMDTFGGIVKGGASGAIIVQGNPGQSVLVQRLTATDEARMPKGGNALKPDEIKKISAWIASGAVFTGDNNLPLTDLKAPAEGAKRDSTPIQINKPTGGETVSFKEDIAPWMVNLCLNCHGGEKPRSGFSVETFEKLMKGGSSGRVVLPGNIEESRLWHLVGKQDPIKMPPGQSVITPANHSNLKKWIEEGAKFDGGDPKAPLRSMVLSPEEKRARELAALSPEQFAQRRKARALELWNAAFSSEPALEAENEAFVVLANVPEPRVQQVADWAKSDAELLRKFFKVKDPLIWRGKLSLFVFRDRFSYEEFVRTNEQAEVPPETRGHSRVTAGGGEAYVCAQDTGDAATEELPGLRTQLFALLTEALLQRSTARVPEWAAKGTGLALAARSDSKNPYFRGLAAGAHNALRLVDSPRELFGNGTLSASDLPPIGYTLVSHLLKKGNDSQFVQLLGQLGNGKAFETALAEIYYTNPDQLYQSYRAYVETLPGSRGAGKKAKK
jgi:hypothetical protein